MDTSAANVLEIGFVLLLATGAGWSARRLGLPAIIGYLATGLVDPKRSRRSARMIDFRVLGPDDWRLWRDLCVAALEDAPAAFGSTLAQWTGSGDGEDRWRSRLADVALNVVLLVDGEPAGMVSALDPNEDSAVELISMWVAPCARGQGVGDAAVRHVVSWAQTEHGASVVLAVKTDNDHAVCLYQRHGFVDAGPSLDDPSERLMTAGIAEAKNDSG